MLTGAVHQRGSSVQTWPMDMGRRMKASPLRALKIQAYSVAEAAEAESSRQHRQCEMLGGALAQNPNFLLITTDQQRADHLGCYGNKVLRTPAIDGLAAGGIAFDRFYVACPICMPNRAAIMTGRMPSVNGTRHNGIPLDRDAVTFVDILRAGGYHTGLVGKSHLQNTSGRELRDKDIFGRDHVGTPPPEELHDASKRRRVGPEYEAELNPTWRDKPDRNGPEIPYYGFDHVRFANGHADNVQGHYSGWLANRTEDPAALRGPANALPSPATTAPQAWRTAIPEELYPTTYIAETSEEFIDHHLQTRGEDPFFLHCSFTDPHHPFTPPGRYFDMYGPEDVELPPSFDSIDPNEPAYLTRLRQEFAEGRARANGPALFCSGPEETRQMIALTYGMITMVDDAVGRLMAFLEDRGVRENTVVIFTSDHGDFMGDHGLMLKHGLHYEGVLRVPFIWADPENPTPVRSKALASSVDISASILARACLAPNNGNQGLDVIALAKDPECTERKGILIEEDELGAHMSTERGLRTRTYIQDDWRLTLWQGMDDGQLYDRGTDPHEMHNLWFDTDHAVQRSTMIEAMLRETIRLSDTSPYATFVA